MTDAIRDAADARRLPSNKTLLRRPVVLQRTGLRSTALDDAIGRGEFPSPIAITDSGRAVAWLEGEVDAWLAARLAKRDEQLIAQAGNLQRRKS